MMRLTPPFFFCALRRVVARRPGDIATCYADPTKAAQVLKFKCTFSIEQAVVDMLRWQTLNPDGFKTQLTAAQIAAALSGNAAPAAAPAASAAAAPAAASK
jgi:hypothetical protein